MILVISNGHGEDVMGATIADGLKTTIPDQPVRAFPVVGMGRAYEDVDIPVVGPRKPMPSGGFAKHGLGYLMKDLGAGLLRLTRDQSVCLKALGKEVKLAIVVGDLYPALVSWAFLKRPILFIPTAKSEYIKGHLAIEKWFMRKTCGLVLARDEVTARALREGNVNALFVGNMMMDTFTITGENFGLSMDSRVVGALPGSREEAYDNMGMILDCVEQLGILSGGILDFLIAFAPNLEIEPLKKMVRRSPWIFIEPEPYEKAKGVVGKLSASWGVVVIARGKFGDVLNVCDLFIGLAGTANEQAVGMGKPVVSFIGNGPQYNYRFAYNQKMLLGDGLSIVPPDPKEVAYEAWDILLDGPKLAEVRKIGRERMGEPGATKRIVKLVAGYLEKGSWPDAKSMSASSDLTGGLDIANQ